MSTGKNSKTARQYENEIIRQMDALHVYHEEFGNAVTVLARMLYDYQETLRMFEESGGRVVVKHTNKAGAVNAVKNPYYQTLEGLRISILAYLRELGLTPAGLKKVNDASMRPERSSPLTEALLALSRPAEEPIKPVRNATAGKAAGAARTSAAKARKEKVAGATRQPTAKAPAGKVAGAARKPAVKPHKATDKPGEDAIKPGKTALKPGSAAVKPSKEKAAGGGG